MRLLAAGALAALAISGCAARLAVEHTATGNGVVLRQPVPHAVTVHVTELDKNAAACGEAYETRFVVVPAGSPYTVNIDDRWAWFAKNELVVEFFESGAPKRVALNSDPELDETLTAAARLVKEAGALVTRAATAGSRVSEVDRESCGQSRDEHILCVQRYEEWVQEPEKCRRTATR